MIRYENFFTSELLDLISSTGTTDIGDRILEEARQTYIHELERIEETSDVLADYNDLQVQLICLRACIERFRGVPYYRKDRRELEIRRAGIQKKFNLIIRALHDRRF